MEVQRGEAMRRKVLALWHEVDLNGRAKVVILRERKDGSDSNISSYLTTRSSRIRVTKVAFGLVGGVKGWTCAPNCVDHNVLVGWGIYAPNEAVYPPPTGE